MRAHKILVFFIILITYLSLGTSCIAMKSNILTLPVLPELYEGVYLEIDKNNNILYIFLNGNISYTYPIATGGYDYQTPEGTFFIITKVENPWYLPKNIPGGDKDNPLGTRWLGISVPDTGGYKYGIHGTNNPNSIGQHISQGCIRMFNKDIEWLYRHIPIGTPVIIK